MRKVLAVILLALALLPVAVRANDAISQVIRDQLTAFQADDFATAFSYASPMIRQLFGTSDRFGQMVQQGYPMVYRPAEVTMLDQRVQGDTTIQRVQIRDASGRTHLLDYLMIDGGEGWLINGVQFVRQLEAGV
jgi:hypothetical protein